VHRLSEMCTVNHAQSVCVYISRGVEKALDQSQTPPVQAEVSEEAAPAGGEEANGPTPEEIAEAEAKVLTFFCKTLCNAKQQNSFKCL
jgi:hypothetical protein